MIYTVPILICLKKYFFGIYEMYLISAEGYENEKVHILIIRKTGKIWLSMKNERDGLGVKNL